MSKSKPKSHRTVVAAATLSLAMNTSISLADANQREHPPFEYSTAYVTDKIITRDDPTAFKDIEYNGASNARMFDRRREAFIDAKAHIFVANFVDDMTIVVRVNAEFGDAGIARARAVRYARFVGRLPGVLRSGIETLSIHKGNHEHGGGSGDILIHTDFADQDERSGHLEEALMHEAVHASIQEQIERMRGWRSAQRDDNMFISTYAEEHPMREDIAESYVLYLGFRYRPERLSSSLRNTIETTMGNRIAFFDAMGLEGSLCPVVLEDCSQ